MIKKLKIKFILIVMGLVSFLLTTLLLAFYIFSAIRLKNESINILTELASKNSIDLSREFNTFFDNKSSKYSSYSVFVMDFNNHPKSTIITYNVIENLTNEQKEYLLNLRKIVEDLNNNEGLLKEYNLRYVYIIENNASRIVFLDKTYEDANLKNVRLNILLIELSGLIGFFAITLIITKIAIEPIEKSMEQQQQLITDISHELKTPLTVISANTEILASRSESTISDEIKWIEYIRTEALRMSSLIQNMLYLAKPKESLAKIDKEKICLSDIAYETVLPFESVCFEKKLTLKTFIEPDTKIIGNADLIKQLIVIFLDNACKYSYEGNNIFFRLFKEQDKIFMSVTNFGNVIHQKDYQRIFDRFYRVDKSRVRTEGGYGLGLSIAKNIAAFHNAKINVLSDAVNGTTFTCLFKI